MISRTALTEILARAVHAPSGDNSQPWRFRIEGNTVSLFNVSDADETQYNFRQRGSYFAHGALIENILIAAKTQGYDGEVTLFPGDAECTARITFTEAEAAQVPLAAVIEKRATNRKPYQQSALKPEHREALIAAAPIVRFLEGRENLKRVATTVSLNEQLLMENRALHDFLFSMIRWSKKDEAHKPGLYLKTMELPPPVQILFRFVLCYWPLVRLLNLVGLSKFIPTQSAPVYEASSAFGAIIIRDTTNEAYVEAGRAFERLWLTATSLGVSLQPVTALPYLFERVSAGEAEAFSAEHQELIRGAYATISKLFALAPEEHIAMLFRVGYGEAPTAISAKQPPVIVE